MKCNVCKLLPAAGAAILGLAVTSPASAQFYKETKLVSDIAGMAAITDPQLINPWGVSQGPTTPFWVSDAGAKVSTIYAVNPMTGAVTKVGLTVNTPDPPSGQVFNGSSDFVVSSGGASGPARFIFAGLDGKIDGWNPGVPPQPPGVTSNQAVLAATGTPPPAVYTGIAFGMRTTGQFLYAANPAGRRVDVFDSHFTKVTLPGSFTDPMLPAGDAPFNVANIKGMLFVSYTGPTGVINVFNTDGMFIRRFATGGTLLNPWGMVVAPADFGKFSNDLLVGDFNRGNPANGPGYISAFELGDDDEAEMGEFKGLLKGTDGNPLAIDGLWALIFGSGAGTVGGATNVLYFAAGIQNEQHGLFGSLATCHGPVISNLSATPNMLPAPNNQFVTVAVNYTVTDDCVAVPACTLTVSNGNGGGDDNNSVNSRNAIIVNAHEVQLLDSQSANGGFTIAVNCTDSLPLSSRATVKITVPHGSDH